MRTLKPAIFRGLFIGLLLVVVSLPGIFAIHRLLGLGNPPATGLILLGATVALTLAIANAVGVYMGQSRSNPWLAALVGLLIGGVSCAVAAPVYGGMVVDGLTHDATVLAWNERDTIIQGARGAASRETLNTVSGTWTAFRAGRVREELGRLQQQAQTAATPQARQAAQKTIELLKQSAARLSAFALLLWVIVVPPAGAAFECRRARR